MVTWEMVDRCQKGFSHTAWKQLSSLTFLILKISLQEWSFFFVTLGCLLMALCYVACCESVLHDIKDNVHDVTVNNYNVLYWHVCGINLGGWCLILIFHFDKVCRVHCRQTAFFVGMDTWVRCFKCLLLP